MDGSLSGAIDKANHCGGVDAGIIEAAFVISIIEKRLPTAVWLQ
jgi:hypothetical protein